MEFGNFPGDNPGNHARKWRHESALNTNVPAGSVRLGFVIQEE
jgi:hypothetical protein